MNDEQSDDPTSKAREADLVSAEQRQDLRRRLRVAETRLLEWMRSGTPASASLVHRRNLEFGSLITDLIAAGVLTPPLANAPEFDARLSWHENDVPFIHLVDHLATSNAALFIDPDDPFDVHERWYAFAVAGVVPWHPDDRYRWMAALCHKLSDRLGELPVPGPQPPQSPQSSPPPVTNNEVLPADTISAAANSRDQTIKTDDAKMVTVKDAASIVHMSEGQISRLVNAGKIESNGLTHGQRRIDIDSAKRYAKSRVPSEQMLSARITKARGQKSDEVAQLRNPRSGENARRLRPGEGTGLSWDQEDSE